MFLYKLGPDLKSIFYGPNGNLRPTAGLGLVLTNEVDQLLRLRQVRDGMSLF